MLKRKSVREVIENPQPNEYYVLVTRDYPMFLRFRRLELKDTPIDLWDRDLAPPKELLKDDKAGLIDWTEYERRFRKEIPEVIVKRKIRFFEELAKGKEIVLVCEEEDEEYPRCHTWILLKIVEA